MKVKNILIDAALMLGREDIADYLYGNSSDDGIVKEVEAITRAYNLVESEMAIYYKPLLFSETITVTGGFIPYTAFSKRVVAVEKIINGGVLQEFTHLANGVKTQSGLLEIIYRYAPERKDFEDDSEFQTGEDHALALGVACEFSLASGLYEQAVTWDRKYKDSLLNICRKKGEKIKMRGWV